MEQQTDECCVESITLLSDGGETTISKLVGRKYGGLDFINVSNAGCNENDNDFRDVEYYDQRDAYTRLGLEKSEDQDPAQDFGAIDIPIKAKNKSFKDESSISSDRSTLSSITNNDVVPMYDDTGHFVAFQDKTTQEAQMQVLQQQLLLHHQQSHLTVPHLPMHLYRQPSLGTRQPSLSLTLQTPPMQRGGKLQSSKTDTTSTLPNTPDKSLPRRSHNLVGNNFVESQVHVDPMMPVASALRSQLQYDDAISGNIINGFNACFCCKVGGLIALFAVVACSATATWFVITDRVSFVDGKLNINIESGGNLEQGDSVELSTLAPSLTPRVRISKSDKLGISMFGQSNQISLSPTMHEINSDMRPMLQPTLLDLKNASKRDNTDSPSEQTSAPTRRPLSKPKTLSLTDGPTLSPSETSVTEGSTPSQQINKPKRRPTSRPVTPNPTNELTPSQSETSAIEEQQTNTPKRRPSLKPIAPSPADEPTPFPFEFVVMNPKDDLTYESSIAAEDMPTEMPVIGDVNEAPSSPRTTSPNEVMFPPTYNTPAPSVFDPIITTLMPISSPSSAPDFDHQVQVELMTSKPTPIELVTEELTESPIVELMTPSSTPSVKQSSNPTDQQITTEPTETPVELMTPPPIPSADKESPSPTNELMTPSSTPSVNQSSNPTDQQITTEPTETPVELMTPPPIPPADKESPSPTNSPIATPLTSSPSPSPTLKAMRMTPTPTLSQIDTDDPTDSPDDQKAPHSLLPAETSSNPTDPPIITPLTFVPTQEVEQVTPSPTQGEMETEAPTRTLVELMTPSPIQQAETSSNPTDPPVIMPLTASPTREVLRMTSLPTPGETDMEDPTESPIELMTPLPTPAEDSTPAPTESTPDPTPYATFESTQDSTPAQSVLELITDTPTEEIIDENEVW